MARILLTWELGLGLGHLANLQPLAQEFCRRGHHVCLAPRALSAAKTAFAGLDVSYRQAPVQTRPASHPINPPSTFAHILHNIGFGDLHELQLQTKAWRQLYQDYRPDLIVFDHSPTALLAAAGIGAKRVLVGTGFFWPPDESPLRNLRPRESCDPGRLRQEEEHVLNNVNQMRDSWNQPPLARLSQLYYRIEESFLLTFEELDHYPRRGNATYWGAWSYAGGGGPVWPRGGGKRIFAYLKPFPALPKLLLLLHELGTPTLIYMNRVNEGVRKRFESTTLQFHIHPLDIRLVAAECDLAILNGNHGTTVSLLLAGKPTLQIPVFLEQGMFSARIADLGAGLVAPARSPEKVAVGLRRLLNSEQYASAAARIASRYREFDPHKQVIGIAERVEAVLHS